MDNIRLDIDKKEAKEFLEFLLTKRQKFVLENSEVFDKLNEYNEKIRKINSIIDQPTQEDYPLGQSWNKRIQYFLKNNPAGLTARQITSLICTIENVSDQGEVKKYYSSIAPTLSAGHPDIYNRETNDKNEYIYSIK